MLQTAGLYRTRCRTGIVRVLLDAQSPLSQDEIADRLGEGRFNKVSIYRTLASLAEAGLVHRAFVDERAGHFELSDRCGERQCHPHFTCVSCGDTHCLTEASIPLARNIGKGFVIQRQQVRLEGLCPGCS